MRFLSIELNDRSHNSNKKDFRFTRCIKSVDSSNFLFYEVIGNLFLI